MKQLVLLLAFVPILIMFSCEGSGHSAVVDTQLVNNSATAGKEVDTELPGMEFESNEHDFGPITQGERVRTEFKFTNTGKSNLIISDARGSCGCTVPEWPREPIKPGDQGVIRVEFNSEGKRGMQEKTITIVTNCEPATRVIRIKADIIVAETAK